MGWYIPKSLRYKIRYIGLAAIPCWISRLILVYFPPSHFLVPSPGFRRIILQLLYSAKVCFQHFPFNSVVLFVLFVWVTVGSVRFM